MSNRAARRAASSASRRNSAPLTSLAYSFADGKPAGMVDVIVTAGAQPTVISGVALREGAMSSGASGGYNSHAVMPSLMAITTTISITVTVGSLDSAANNRAVGPGIFSADGMSGIYVRFASSSSTASLITWNGTAETTRKSLGSQAANTGDTITLTGTLSGGVWTWTVKKNSGADIGSLTWADSGHAIDLPGYKPGIAFRHQYSGSNYYSRGVTNIVATAA